MGHRISWISVAAKAPDAVLAELGLVDSGEPAVPGATPVAGARLANGSYVLVFDAFQHPRLDPMLMKVLSLNCFVVGGAEDENTNASLAFACRDGQRSWQVAHLRSEGDGHLQVDGTPPRIVASLMRAALAERAKHGHDAVFGVPAALAREVCDFRFGEHPALRFTRLDDRLANLDATLAEVVKLAVDTLEAEGYVQDAAGGNKFLYTKTTVADRIDVCLDHSTLPEVGAVHFGARFSVRNELVQGFMAQAPEVPTTLTAIVGLHEGPVGFGHLASPAEVAAFKARLQGELPGFLRGLHDIARLDALVNDGRPRYDMLNRPTLSQYDTQIGFSRLGLAYLAGNPAFEEMARQTDLAISGGKRDPASNVNRICDALRANARPPA